MCVHLCVCVCVCVPSPDYMKGSVSSSCSQGSENPYATIPESAARPSESSYVEMKSPVHHLHHPDLSCCSSTVVTNPALALTHPALTHPALTHPALTYANTSKPAATSRNIYNQGEWRVSVRASITRVSEGAGFAL